ncbi:MAG TPA: ABC transporter permease, partial [Bryobacteraceae bacterium]|nr:ABC transporter permease [Bryobacteraceae bacterium]
MFPKADVVTHEVAIILRTLHRERAFSLLSVVLLALGIGLVSAVFTLIWQVIYAQLPVAQPSQIYTFASNVTHAGREDSDANAQTFSLPTYRYLAAHFTAAAGVIARAGELANLDTPDGPRHLKVDFVSANFFPVLGIKPAIGTVLTHDRLAGMLSYEFWQESFGAQPNVWNSTIHVNGVPFRIIGVTPPGFGGLIAGQVPKLYLPIAAYADVNPGWYEANNWSVRWLNAFVRLPGIISRQRAQAQLQSVYRAAVRQELASGGAASPAYLRELSHEFLSLVPASQGVHSNVESWTAPLKMLQWMTLAILFLASLNVAGLAVVRALKQKSEILIRYAVGASRPAVMRLHFLQTIILSFAGGLLGLLVAHWTVRLLVHLAHLDYNGFLYRSSGWTIAGHWTVVLVTGLLVGLLPAWQATRVDLAGGLNEGALTHSATRSQVLTRRSLAGAQIALSLVLSIAAALFAKSLYRTLSVPVGFNSTHLNVFAIDPKISGNTLPGAKLLFTNLADRLQTTPEVTSVTYGSGGPFPQEMDVALIDSTAAFSQHQSATRNSIGPRYFSTLGIPLRAGREFDA